MDETNDQFHGSALIKKHSLNTDQIKALESDVFKALQTESINSDQATANRLSGADIPFSIDYVHPETGTEEENTKTSCCGKPKISNNGISKGPISDYSVNNNSDSLLPPKSADDNSKNTLVVDVDETLVHSSFAPMTTPDFVFRLKGENDGQKLNEDSELLVSVRVRPYATQFISELSNYYELVIFSNFGKNYTNEILSHIDPDKRVKHVLYHDSIFYFRGTQVKDISRLGRDLNRIIIIDNNQSSFLLQPYNAIQISTWYRDKKDTELKQIMQFLIENHKVTDIYSILVQK